MKTLLLILILSIAAVAQSASGWHNLTLDKSTPDEAIAELGKPKTDKTGERFRPLKFDEWFDVKAKDFRVLHYEDGQAIEGFKDVKLIFRNDKLVSIDLEPAKLAASALPRAYGVEFKYVSDKLTEAMKPRDFERNQGQTYPKSFPTVYYVWHAAEGSFIFAMITNNSFGSILGKSMGVQDAGENLPGKAVVIELISRSLEEKKSTNLLK